MHQRFIVEFNILKFLNGTQRFLNRKISEISDKARISEELKLA